MRPTIRNAIISGIVFGLIVILMDLIGLFETLSDILAGFIFDKPTEQTLLASLVFILVLMGMWAGARGAQPLESSTRYKERLGALTAGFTTGLIVAVFVIIIGAINAQGIDMRKYLAQMSPDSIEFFLFGKPPLTAALIYILLFTAAGLAGGLVSLLLGRGRLSRGYEKLRTQLLTSWETTSLARRINQFTYTQQVVYGVLVVLALALPFTLGQYWNFTLGTVGIYVLMGLGINIVVGLAGLLDLGYVAFFAVGAYTVGLLTSPQQLSMFQISFWPAAILGIIIAAITGIILGIPVLRLRGDYLAIVTLGFGEIIRILIRSDLLSDYLGGPQGIRDISGPSLFGVSLTSDRAYMIMIILSILLAIFVTIRFQESRVGRSWIAMREDETVAQAMGINTYTSKLMAFAVGAAFAGLGGVLFASRNQYIGPEDANLLVSINVLAVVIVGGMGSIPGVFVGAFVLKGLPEILRQLQDYRILAFGALLVVFMIVRPEGLWPSKRRRLEMRETDMEEEADSPPIPPGTTPPVSEESLS
jgi:ABC-type branched-subunit amino acid transport system permease subunit